MEMKMQKYIREPVEVKAIQFDIRKAEEDCLKYYPMVQDMYELTSAELPDHRVGERFYLKDIHHSSVIHDGDYIYKESNDQCFAVGQAAFELNYKELNENVRSN